ncbi:MAG: type I DNA topoisomerase [Anaerolineae bacterium]
MDEIQAYCLKCKAKVIMENPQPGQSKSGSPGISGKCPQCSSALFRPTGGAVKKQSASKRGSSKKGKQPSRIKTPASRGRNLVIVESPAKARTIQRYLGKEFTVKASIGHVRDLLRSRLSVDVEHDFQPTYRVPPDKTAVVKELKEAVAHAGQVYLATDPDREGEAIAWHLMAATDLDEERTRRVVFHEITRDAIESAFSSPRGIDMHLVDAQQARRILDRLVGYQLSPLLWEKVRSHLSAGRVQSVAVRLLVEREREIQQFVPEEYWTLDALLSKISQPFEQFKARLQRINGADAELTNEAEARQACEDLQPASFRVAAVKHGSKRRSPAPPFITSTLQQEAARALGFQAARTMRAAQQLYEGVELGPEGSVGLITYMRTDSVNVAEVALQEARQLIRSQFGPQFLPDQPIRYRTRSKLAQEAHEAIRPTSVLRTPDKVAPFLSRDQLALYRLIWRRFLASQMLPAVYDTMTVDVEAQGEASGRCYLFRASGATLRFPGFLVVYGESTQKDEEPPLPKLEQGEPLKLEQLLPEQHFTQPPARYSEASLIRELESKGIGRPSTYATIISTIINRGYVERKQRTLIPTDIAFVVNDLLVKHFPEVMDVGFTAQMEDNLDDIAGGRKEWVPVVRAFYEPFSKVLAEARQGMEAVRPKDEPAGFDCDRCGAPMIIKYGRFGKFIGCSKYPECKNTKPFLNKIGVKCPDCGGELVQRRSRKGRSFYGCERYPDCRFASYARPLAQSCPKCGKYMVQQGRNRARCSACGATASLAEPAPATSEPAAELA